MFTLLKCKNKLFEVTSACDKQCGFVFAQENVLAGGVDRRVGVVGTVKDIVFL